jgi:hypothetical protein
MRRAQPATLAFAFVALALVGPAVAAPKKESAGGESGFVGQMQVTATIMQSMRPAGLLQVDAGLVVPDPILRTRVQGLGPVIRAAWRSAAQDYVNRQYTRGRVPDARLMAANLQAATDRVVGRPGAQVVMISLIAR